MSSPQKPSIESEADHFSVESPQYQSYESSLGALSSSENPNGEIRILIILVRLASDSIGAQIRYGPISPFNMDPEPVTVEKADSIFFDNRYPGPWNVPEFLVSPASSWENYINITFNDYFREVSYDQMRITGQVVGEYTLNLDTLEFSTNIFVPAIDSAISDGVNLQWGGFGNPFITGGDFDRVIVISTMQPISVGGIRFGDFVWLNGRILLNTVVQELFHTFGAGHASGWFCHNTSWPSAADTSCGLIQGGGDIFDPMGSGEGHVNARIKGIFGWLQSSQFKNVSLSGTYNLTPLESADGIKVLIIPRGPLYYYFQFRRYVGFDEYFLHANRPFGVFMTNCDGLFVHMVDTLDIFRDGFILDMPPYDQPNNGSTIRESVLGLGATYVDSIVGFSVTPLSISGVGESAQLAVNIEIFGYADFDGDSVVNADDNCPLTFNPGQEDINSNGIGDVCEYCCLSDRGDVNGDGNEADILDLTYLVDFIFRGGLAPPCPAEADTNSDDTPANILDLTFLVDRIFRGGPAPGPC
ncbi:MAG: hypothetical protein IIC66_11975 [candidate division Zixibacteria bacterium]|nr:hypothetical protein [candidate division Zixibacteria bacterium]